MDATLAKGLSVIDWLVRQQRDCRASEVAQAFGLARSNAHRTLQTLVECGWAVQDAVSSAYRPSLRLFELGALVEAAADLRVLLTPHLARLAEATGETIHLAVLDGAEIVYLHKFDSPLPVAAYSRVGGRSAAHCMASGKALLAALGEDEAALRRRLGSLHAHTPHSLTSYPALLADLQRTRQRGVAENREEWRLGVCGLGAPVFNARGEPVAAIGISVPSIRFARSQVRKLSDLLLETAAEAARTLGYRTDVADAPPPFQFLKETRMKLITSWKRWAGGVTLAALATLAAAPTTSLAQGAYPDKAVRFVVPYPPGGGTDVIARIVQNKFQQVLGQTIVIDNRGGGGGSLGTDIVAKSPADGYSVLFTLSSHSINPAIFPRLPFDTERDFEPVGVVASLPQILVALPSFEAGSVAELIALAKKKPGQLSFASVGNGSPSHLAGELLNLRAGIKIQHIPYRGGGPAITDVLGGQVPMLWVSIPAAAQFVKTGKLKALAVSTVKRSAAFPEVPTMQEAGVADFEVDSWYAMFVPAKTPRPVIEKLNQALNTVVADAEIKQALLGQGSEAVGGRPEALGRTVTAEIQKWTKLVKEANIKVE